MRQSQVLPACNLTGDWKARNSGNLSRLHHVHACQAIQNTVALVHSAGNVCERWRILGLQVCLHAAWNGSDMAAELPGSTAGSVMLCMARVTAAVSLG